MTEMTYQCLACGNVVQREDPAELPRGTERCSHEWEAIPGAGPRLFQVLKVDGPNIMTDKGGIGLNPFQYADGGKTHPVGTDDWRMMRALFLAAPEAHAILLAIHEFFRHHNPIHPSAQVLDDDRTLAQAVEEYIAKAKGTP